MHFRNAVAAIAVFSALVLAMIWLEVGRDLRWLDAAFAVGSSILVTPFIFVIRRRSSGVTSTSFVARFVAGFVVYLWACALLLLLPRVYLHFLHGADRSGWAHDVFFVLAWSLLMGLSRATSKGDAPPLPKPGEPGYDLKKEPWFS